MMIATWLPKNVIDAQHSETHIGDGTLRRLQVPMLMYHYVGDLPEEPDQWRVGLTVSRERFRQHMQFLSDNGYTPISLYEVSDALSYGTPLPQRPVVLTFDDGHADHYNNVFPILREYGFSGTFFIITQFVDQGLPQYVTWQQLQTMANAGMSIEAHTKTHIDLRNRSYDELVYQIVGSIESIETHIGQRPRIFSYPAGRYDDNTLAVIDSTDVLIAVTTRSGTWHSSDRRLELARMRVQPDTSVAGLRALLNYEP